MSISVTLHLVKVNAKVEDHGFTNVFFSERLRSGALLLTLPKKFSGGLRPPDPPMCYITFTMQYNVPENFLVDIFLKFLTGKVILLSQNELVLPRRQNDSAPLCFFGFQKSYRLPHNLGNATTCYIPFECFQQVERTSNIYLIFTHNPHLST